MKKIYVAHPFQGKQENFDTISNICNRLTSMGYMPISPVHAFRFLDDNKEHERKTALKFCRELLHSGRREMDNKEKALTCGMDEELCHKCPARHSCAFWLSA